MIRSTGQVLHRIIDRRDPALSSRDLDPVTLEWWTPLYSVSDLVSAESLARAGQPELLEAIVWRAPVDLAFSPLLRARLQQLLPAAAGQR